VEVIVDEGVDVVGFGEERVELGTTASNLAINQIGSSVVGEPLHVNIPSVHIHCMVFASLK
jgi:hypothetical protein